MQTAHTQKQPSRSREEECATPATDTEEFKVWWESQYDPAESHNITSTIMNENIEVIDGTPLELNTIFYELDGESELEEEAMAEGADFVGK